MINMQQLSFRYESAQDNALNDISLHIHRGEFLGIIGPSGAGKSTLLSVISGVIPHHYTGDFYGACVVDGMDTVEVTPTDLSRVVGSVFQDIDAQMVSSMVEDEVLFALENFGVPAKELDARVQEALETVGIADLRHRSLDTLSGGQKQKVAIAAVLAMRPQVLVLDEPTGELDPASSQAIFRVLRALNEQGTTVIVVEQKIMLLCEYVDRLLVMDAGKIVFDGRSEEVTANAARVRSLALQNGALDFIELSDARQCADIWRVRGALVKAMEAVSEQEPVDIVVPISRTADFIRFINDLEAQSGMQMVSFGHAGDGNVHLCVVRGERDEETWQRELHENMDRAYAEAYRLGGVASGEHGIGLSKRPYFLRQTAKENLQAMNAIKTALDPQHILNNGKSYLTGGNNNAGTF